MKLRKMELLRKTIELSSAINVWKDVGPEGRAKVLGQYLSKPQDVARLSGSNELPNFEDDLGKDFYAFVSSVVALEEGPIVLTEEEVASLHNSIRKRPWNIRQREVRGLAIKQGKRLGVRHVSPSSLELLR